MSDNIYNILNNFNKVAQEPQKPATQSQPKAKTQLQESMDHVLAEKYMGFKKAASADKKSGEGDSLRIGSNLPQSDTETFGIEPGRGYKVNTPKDWKPGDRPRAIQQLIPTQDKKDHIRSRLGKHKAPVLPEGEVEESGLQAYLGNKKYGKDGMDALRKAGRDGASKEKMAKIRAKHDKMDEAAKPDYIDLDKDGNKAEPMKKAAKDAKSKKVQEVAPPGAKAERMVKHIKKGYAKDGKLSKTEKSKAYGAAWKAHNKGKIEEAIKAMYEAGFSKEQIIEGWDDMMKSVEKRSKDKGTGKFDKKQISTGTVYTRKYDPKTGETDDSENVTAVKRGRGRPKKSTFESSTTANRMIAEHFREFIEGSIQGGVWTSNPPKKGQSNVPVPQNIDGGSASPAPKAPTPKPSTPPMGSIKGGVWTAEPPKPGEKGVAVPSALPEDDMEEGNAFGGAVAKAKADGVQPGETIKVGGKTYPVKEGEELLQMLRIAGIKVLEDTQLDECGMSSMGNGMMGQHEQEGRMNVSTNMSSDGNKSVTITADGNSALELMQMLKLAGMDGADHGEEHTHSEPEGVMVVSAGDEEEVDEAKDSRYEASTTPEEHVMPVQVQTKGGDGDVAGREKKMTPHGYQFGDNPQAMKESMSLKLIKEYEAIKVKK